MPILDGSAGAAATSVVASDSPTPLTPPAPSDTGTVPSPVPVPSPGKFVHVAHRGGRRTWYVSGVTGSRGSKEDLVATLQNSAQSQAVAAAATATVCVVDSGSRQQRTVALRGLAAAQPDALGDVRRSVSHVGQPNYAGTIVAPTESWAWRPAWCESLNERYHYLDLLTALPVRQMATQCMRFEWRLPSGIRTHVPDAFLFLEGERRVLVDVTTASRLESPPTRAVFALTAATCRELGWGYEVRPEMPLQRQRNLSFLRCFARASPTRLQQWRSAAGAVIFPVGVDQLARVLGDGDARRGLGPVWSLMAAGDVHADLSEPLQPDTALRRGRSGTSEYVWVEPV